MDPLSAPPPPHSPATPTSSRPDSKVRETAREFEAVFLGQMTKLMMETVEIGDEFSGGHGEEMFRGVLAERLGEAIAKRGGVGLAPAVLEHMIRMQGGSPDGK